MKRFQGSGGGEPYVAQDTLFSQDWVEFVVGVCEGPIGGLYTGPQSFYLDNTPLIDSQGNPNFQDFQLRVYHGNDTPTQIYYELGGETSSSQVNVQLAQAIPVVRNSPPALQNSIDVIELRLLFNQLVWYQSDGDVLQQTADFTIEYRKSGDADWVYYNNQPNLTVRGKTTSGYVKEYRWQVPRVEQDWEVRVTQNSPENNNNRIVNITFESIQWVTQSNRSYPDLSVIHGVGKASDQFSSIPDFTGVYAGKIIKIPTNYDPVTRYYDGVWDGTFKDGHTDNPAWCLYDLLTNARYGFKAYYPDLLVDRFSFYDAAQWCDEFVPIPDSVEYQPRYTYNDMISESRLGLEMVHYLAGMFGGVLVSDLNGSVKLAVDRPGTIVQVFGEESVSAEGFQYQFTDITQRYNDFKVSFINPDLQWEQDVRQVFDQVEIDANGRVSNEMVAVGCIDPYEAQRRAYRKLIQATTEVTTVTFSTARQGLLLELFDLIGVSDRYMNWGLSGRVKSVAGNTVTLRDALFLPVNTNITMEVQSPSGITALTVQTVVANTTELTITAGTYPVDAPANAQFTLSQGSIGLVKPFRIVAIEQDNSNPEMMSITAVEHNVNKYSDSDNMVSSGTVAYDYEASEIPPAPINLTIESGTEHLYKTSSGQVISRMFIRWEQSRINMIDHYLVYYRRKDADNSFQSIRSSYREILLENVEDTRVYEVFVIAVNHLGKRSAASPIVEHTVIGKTEPPANVTGLSAQSIGPDVKLTWDANTEIDFSYFEIRTGASWETGVIEGTTQKTSFYDRNIQGSSLTYMVKAFDTSGNESVNATTQVLSIEVPATPTATFQFDGSEFVITMAFVPTGTIPLLEYVVRCEGIECFRGQTTIFRDTVNWVGPRSFEVTVVNTAGQESTPRVLTGVVSAPGVPVLRGEVIDNNVLLRWTNAPGTLPILRTEIRKGATFAAAEVLWSADATFAAFFEAYPGIYTYWVVSVDSAGNYGPEVPLSLVVDEPPDFEIFTSASLDLITGTKVNVIEENGKLIFGVDTV